MDAYVKIPLSGRKKKRREAQKKRKRRKRNGMKEEIKTGVNIPGIYQREILIVFRGNCFLIGEIFKCTHNSSESFYPSRTRILLTNWSLS